ncbi:15590_t:CDS:2 [Dentiscutata erythropus]|uniref:15590_t:CDS:1 n=1 Tax=Dentiscutata erythropus TaxID=1348616 RepID=A0A9N8ZSR6_9GLOM|nr:15590_t:CDS:2 [Dentiscutata erythropus]
MSSHQKSFSAILTKTKTTIKTTFTVFNKQDVIDANEITRKYYAIANDTKYSDSIQAVFDQAIEDCKTNDVKMIQHALMTFVTHHPGARKRRLKIPSLTHRNPSLSIPAKPVYMAPGPVVGDKPVAPIQDVSGEEFLDYWREDPNLNEHHEHWHIVYSDQPLPDPQFPDDKSKEYIKDRQGELFIYMHKQMNARYTAERLAIGLGVQKPLENYDELIPEGYAPSKHLVDNMDETTFSTRPSGLKLADVSKGGRPGNSIKVAELAQARDNIRKAIEQGHFDDANKTPISIELLGHAIESGLSQPGFEKYSIPFHNNGHMLLSLINFQNTNDLDRGVMADVRVACRDPVFWRWHKHVDDLFKAYQEKLGPNHFNDCPSVKISSDGIILCFKDKIPGIKGLKDPQQDDEATKWGEKTFGGHNFHKEHDQHSTNELETKMKQRKFTWVEDDQSSQTIEYLFPREWYYFFRVENTSNKDITATFRVFIVPIELCNDFAEWIEVDKFKQEIPANSRTVVARDCDRSSVVRQPPQKTLDELDDTAIATESEDDESDEETYCDCGWPFHLLLPRGSRNGMKFKLFVFISDWEKDKVPRVTRCGSLSFCGAEKPKDKYPDIRPMGYPFDRPLKDGSFEKTFAGLQNTASRDITIRWVDNYPDWV